ncbi:LysR family transcriptional regulator [Rheinheimera tangshanensis]|jgi:DNA-binding transcriptional LysR family regulator|uniref:LysR family transcriptional regulator n=1 Tax=Rheinheimera tangshanensis TaxID=400153 RepID=A0A5C8LZI1_9GAMM|nr:LysR family transcriptional regulator [Rheinheimera tangshanensis]TXK81734.1 LysR family transcriptional regulator [Rheinheimera tangshanensis]GGM55609.1 transcriptional regulator [Rheinheimera tangshanensis]
MEHLDWSDIRLFLAVAEQGTLTAAARAVGFTQPTLGRRIQSLEQSLGLKLFQRTTEGFLLTEAGLALLPAAKRMAEEADAAMRQLAGQEVKLTGTLRISSFDWFSHSVLTDCCAEFLQLHPDVSIELLNDSRLFNLARREADLVFRLQAFDEPDIAQRQLLLLDYGLYAAADFDLSLLNTPEQLKLISMDNYFSDLPDVVWLNNQFPGAKLAFSSNSREAQARLCVAGLGLAVLPVRLAEQMQGLQQLPVASAPPSRPIWLGYHQDLRHQRRLRAFIDFITQRLGAAK